jgi:hypothetical protein
MANKACGTSTRLGFMKERLLALSQHAEQLASTLGEDGRKLRPDERQLCVMATIPALQDQFEMMIANLLLDSEKAPDYLDGIMKDVIELKDI